MIHKLLVSVGKETGEFSFSSKAKRDVTLRATMKHWRRFGKIVVDTDLFAAGETFSRGWSATWDLGPRGTQSVVGASLKFGSSRYVAAVFRFASVPA